MTKYTNIKNIVVLGGGESGTGAAILAQKKGYNVFLSDKGEIKKQNKEALNQYLINWEEKQHSNNKIFGADLIIKSPGIPDYIELIKKIKAKNIPVISEIEFAGHFTDAIKICITGSNGKTTTTSLIYHILKKAGLNVGLGGNIGKSFAWQIAENDFDYYVLELSSFQLDGIIDFKPEIAILMNITPDHLDRYDNKFQNYIDSKFRIVQNMTEKDYLIFCSDDEIIKKEITKRKLTLKLLPFSLTTQTHEGAFANEEKLMIKLNNTDFTMTIKDLALQGKHNTYNSMAAGIAAKLMDIRKATIKEALQDFKNVPHRLEKLIKVRGVEFINDSKATNVNSTWYALESMTKKVIWIVGGVDKGNDYNQLMPLVKDKVKGIVALGIDTEKIHRTFEHFVAMTDARTMNDAVKEAYLMADPDDVVLLSPCCASFDLFKNYQDRGEQFKEAVYKL